MDNIKLECEKEYLNNKSIVLIDDVLHTGKTLIYCVKYLLDVSIKNFNTVVLNMFDRHLNVQSITFRRHVDACSTTLRRHVYEILTTVRRHIDDISVEFQPDVDGILRRFW